jgi:hypothetical protein
VRVVASGKVAPHQHHGRARGDSQEDAPGQVASPQRHLEHLHPVYHDHFARAVRIANGQADTQGYLDEVDGVGTYVGKKQGPEKKACDEVHRERLDGPVDEKGQSYRT